MGSQFWTDPLFDSSFSSTVTVNSKGLGKVKLSGRLKLKRTPRLKLKCTTSSIQGAVSV